MILHSESPRVVPYTHLIPYACQFESYNPVNPLILQILIQTRIKPMNHLRITHHSNTCRTSGAKYPLPAFSSSRLQSCESLNPENPDSDKNPYRDLEIPPTVMIAGL